MLSSILILAQETTDKKTSSGSGLLTFLPILLIGVAMYFLLIRPQRRRMKEQQALVSQLDEGDEIITNGGIYGFITAIDGDILWVEIDSEKNVEIRIHRSSVTRKINPTVEPAGGMPVLTEDAADDSDRDDDSDTKHKK